MTGNKRLWASTVGNLARDMLAKLELVRTQNQAPNQQEFALFSRLTSDYASKLLDIEQRLKRDEMLTSDKDRLDVRIAELEAALSEMINLVEEYKAEIKHFAYPGWGPHELDEEVRTRAYKALKGEVAHD
jgi:hypothetical protein